MPASIVVSSEVISVNFHSSYGQGGTLTCSVCSSVSKIEFEGPDLNAFDAIDFCLVERK